MLRILVHRVWDSANLTRPALGARVGEPPRGGDDNKKKKGETNMDKTYKISLGHTDPSTGFKEIFRTEWEVSNSEEALNILIGTVTHIIYHTGSMGVTPEAALAYPQQLERIIMDGVVRDLGKKPLKRMAAPIDDLIPNYGALIELRAPGEADVVNTTHCLRVNTFLFITKEERENLLLAAPDGLAASVIGKETELGNGGLTLNDLIVLHDLACEAREKGKVGFCVVGPEDDDRACFLLGEETA